MSSYVHIFSFISYFMICFLTLSTFDLIHFLCSLKWFLVFLILNEYTHFQSFEIKILSQILTTNLLNLQSFKV